MAAFPEKRRASVAVPWRSAAWSQSCTETAHGARRPPRGPCPTLPRMGRDGRDSGTRREELYPLVHRCLTFPLVFVVMVNSG